MAYLQLSEGVRMIGDLRSRYLNRTTLNRLLARFNTGKNGGEEQGVILTRNQKILYKIDKDGLGLEIGPSHNPIAPKRSGYNVEIIDHTNRDQLIEKFKAHGVEVDNIEEVDYVWDGEPYAELTGKSKAYDWIIASHVIEHTPDMIGFLNDCDSVLKDDGMLSLVVPDRRYCFDYFRPSTGISKIIDAHYSNNKRHTPGTVAEFFLNASTRNGQPTWEKGATGEHAFIHLEEQAPDVMQTAAKQAEYIDVHAWCFTPQRFRLMIVDLFNLGLIPFKEVCFFQTVGCEFYISLSRDGKGPSMDRLELSVLTQEEV